MSNGTSRTGGIRLSNKESKEITRESIRVALLMLMKGCEFDKITVTAIINRSGVSRAGFYRNYSSKEDVMQDICAEIRGKLSEVIANEAYFNDPKLFYRDVFHAIKSDPSTFSIIMDANVPRKYIMSSLPEIPANEKSADAKEYYTFIALLTSLRTIVYEWFRKGMQEDEEVMAEIIYGIFHEGK
ncbi:MAG: TetR/AcrR family transcriptional regulator [Eubacteriaceae bacterium]|nr:TetR/AcrR family transcriptional regulator [Eubacteriaceae bacterium]